MRTKLTVGMAALGLVIAAAAPTWAHHAFSAIFDQERPVELRGTVSKVELINPHSWIWVDVETPDGVVNWGIEGGSPNSLIRNGITRYSLPVGTEILVAGFRARDGSNMAVGATITLADGEKLFFGGSAPDAAGPGSRR